MDKEKYLFRRQFILGSHYVESLERWKKVAIDDRMFLTAHPDLEVSKITTEEKTIVLLGYVIDPFNSSSSNLEIIKRIVENISVAEDIFP